MVFFFWKKECWCLQTNVLGVGLLCDEGVGIGGGMIVVAAWGVCGGPRWPVVPGDTWLNCSDFFFFFTRTVITARLGNAPERWVVSAQRNRRQQWARPKKHVNWFSGTVALILIYCQIANFVTKLDRAWEPIHYFFCQNEHLL